MSYDFVAHFPNASGRSQMKSFVMTLPACPLRGELCVNHKAEPTKRKQKEGVMYHKEAKGVLVVKIHTSVISS